MLPPPCTPLRYALSCIERRGEGASRCECVFAVLAEDASVRLEAERLRELAAE